MRLFTDVLRETRNGALVDECSEKLNELTKAVVEESKGGTLTLTLSIQPGRGGAYILADKVVIKAPEPAREATLFFANKDYDLQRNDPNQLELGVRAIPDQESDKEVRQI